MTDGLPSRIEDTGQLEDVLTTPGAALIEDLARLDGDILVLGVGGKMGPTLAGLAKRAAPGKRVIGVARFSEQGLEERLRRGGIETIACDLLDREALAALPDGPERRLHGGPKIRHGGPGAPYLGDERADAGAGRRALCGQPHRRVLDGLRLSLRAGRIAGRHRGYAAAGTARRVRQLLRRPRADARAFFAQVRHARPHHPAELRDRPALRRAG